jgi:hypothetical protein
MKSKINEAKIKKGDVIKMDDGEIGVVNKLSGKVAYIKLSSMPGKFHPIEADRITYKGKHKGKDLYSESKLEEHRKVGDKVKYLGHPAVITNVKDYNGNHYYSVSYNKGNGKTKASNILSGSGSITEVESKLTTESMIGIQTKANFKPLQLKGALERAGIKGYQMNRLSVTLTALKIDKKDYKTAMKIIDALRLKVMMAKESKLTEVKIGDTVKIDKAYGGGKGKVKDKKGSFVIVNGSSYHESDVKVVNESKLNEDYSQRARNFRVNLRKRLIGMKKGQKVSYGKAKYVKMVDGNFQIPKTGKVYGVEDIVQAMKRAVKPDILRHRGAAGADMVNAYLKFESKLNEEGRPIPMDKPNEFAYIDFKKYANQKRSMFKKEMLKHVRKSDGQGDSSRMFMTLSALWYKWAYHKNKEFSHIKDKLKFGRALMGMMVQDDLIFDKKAWKKDNNMTHVKGFKPRAIESVLRGQLAGDSASDMADLLRRYGVKKILKQPNDSVTYLQLNNASQGTKIVAMLKKMFGIKAQIDNHMYSPTPAVKFDNDQIAESKLKEHTVSFSKDEMDKLHAKKKVSKNDPDGKEHFYTYDESVDEMMDNTGAQGAPKNEASSLWKRFDDLQNLRSDSMDLEYAMMNIAKYIKQLHKDMEQQAEPEGGKVADKYGKQLDKWEKAYKKKKAEFKKIMAKIDKLEQF